MSAAPLRVLVVDDSVVYRQLLERVVASIDGCECVGSAVDGEMALELIRQRRPDLVTLDVEMPRLDGLDVLRRLNEGGVDTSVVMVSGLTRSGSQATLAALALGAFDFVTKPDSAESASDAERQLRGRLAQLVEVLREERRTPRTAPAAARVGTAPRVPAGFRPEILAIGVSTGGPRALPVFLEDLPGDLPVPVLIVQHMPPVFTQSLAETLDRRCALRVKEAEDGEPLLAGHVYIAPGGLQMRVDSLSGARRIVVRDDPPERGCKPSVNYLFRSLASCCGTSVLAVIMTGMGNDGTQGSMLLKRKGSVVLAQDESSCTVYGMPREAVAAGVVDLQLPLTDLAQGVMRYLPGHR